MKKYIKGVVSMRKNISIIISTGIVLLSLAGCGAGEKNPVVEVTPVNQNIGTISSQSFLYVNKILGFSLELPKKWSGSYDVKILTDANEKTKDVIELDFVGKSEKSKNGLPMFYIGTKEALSAGNYKINGDKIGTTLGKDYFYATSTEDSLGVLDIEHLSAGLSQEFDSIQKELMQSEFKKAKEMEKDADTIVKSFKSN